jgi:hypothetical protein
MSSAPATKTASPGRARARFILLTVLTLGLHPIIHKLSLNPRLNYLMWGLIAANEIRGMFTVYGVIQNGGLF